MQDQESLLNDLEQAAFTGSPEAYMSALEIDQYRNALIQRASELRTNFEKDIRRGARRIAPKYYGWEPSAQIMPALQNAIDFSCMDEDDLWRSFRDVAAHEYDLEDPVVADQFFAEMQEIMTRQDLEGVDRAIISDNFPWLGVEGRKQRHKQLFSHPLLQKYQPKDRTANQRNAGPPQMATRIKTESISERRLREDLEAKEAKIRQELSSKFRATPVPISSIIPKYDLIRSCMIQ
eukprot:jgi/Hompol1/5250/HPOL_000663-RA